LSAGSFFGWQSISISWVLPAGWRGPSAAIATKFPTTIVLIMWAHNFAASLILVGGYDKYEFEYH
jgi:hypothetical protein